MHDPCGSFVLTKTPVFSSSSLQVVSTCDLNGYHKCWRCEVRTWLAKADVVRKNKRARSLRWAKSGFFVEVRNETLQIADSGQPRRIFNSISKRHHGKTMTSRASKRYRDSVEQNTPRDKIEVDRESKRLFHPYSETVRSLSRRTPATKRCCSKAYS